jgi:hypothetical protein
MTHEAPLRWRKSARSGSQSNCVEVPQTLDRVRDSKNNDVVLMVGAGWSAFLAATKNGVYSN